MGQPLVRYIAKRGEEPRWGVVFGDAVRPLTTRAATMSELLASGSRFNPGRGAGLPLKRVQILSPVTPPCQVICQGKNYDDHIRETGSDPAQKSFNLFFQKATSSLAPPSGTLQRPPGVKLLDYEIELGLVIGRAIRGPLQLEKQDLARYIAGLVIGNDISARDIQVPQGQWFKGKSFRGFCPVGPVFYHTTAGDLERLAELQLELRVNDSVRQQALAGQMIFPPHETLSELSTIMDLEPGDLILTGTPAGVSMQVKQGLKTSLAQAFLPPSRLWPLFVNNQLERPYLNDGDQITASIRTNDGAIDLGMQELTVKAAAPG